MKKEFPEKLEYLNLAPLGLSCLHHGKVRDTWSLRSVLGHDDYLLVVASDRISIFDFVLNASVPQKGEVLTALTHFWFNGPLINYANHLIPSKSEREANYALDLHIDGLDIPVPRCLVVKNLTGAMYDFEMIFRHHIGGSIFKKYQATGLAAGHLLPPGLPKWSKLNGPIFTPSTKADIGHDINVDADYFFREMTRRGKYEEAKKVVDSLSSAYSEAYKYAKENGILILDTKFEVAGPIIADEILTPDSSRFVLESDWEEAMNTGRDPYFQDKQPVRDWGMTVPTPFFKDEKPVVGINNLDPTNPNHLAFVYALEVPKEIVTDTTNRYLDLFYRLTGNALEHYQWEKMGMWTI